MQQRILVVMMSFLVSGLWVSIANADAPIPCEITEQKSVKIEGWVNKQYKKKLRSIKKEFKEIKGTRTSLRAFPMGKTAKVIGIGRCVPAYIARHTIKKALKYTGGIESLVNQAFLPPHWMGIGTTQFDEPSQQLVSAKQVDQLLDPELSDQQFHEMYRKFSVQSDTIPYFGSRPDNPRKVD